MSPNQILPNRTRNLAHSFSKNGCSQTLAVHQALLKGTLRCGLLGPKRRDSALVVLGWDLSIWVSNEFPGESDASGSGTTL